MNRVQHIPSFALESGVALSDVVQAWRVYGTLNARRDNAIFIFHSLTGSPAAAEWWEGIVGPGRALDTERYAVFCPNLLGSCYGTSRLPAGTTVTPRDMARLAARLIDAHGITGVALATGGSLGGMVAMEWALETTSLTRAVVVLAAPAANTAQAIGYNHVQRRALELGGDRGLALARMAAMLTYRTGAQFQQRFGRERREDGVFQVQSYLDYQGQKLVARMNAEAYRTMLDATDAHDVGRGRGGIEAALKQYEGALYGVGITGDLLYPPPDVRAWTELVGAEYREVVSPYGHDAFLLEAEQIGAVLREALRAGEQKAWQRQQSAALEAAS